MFIPFTGKMNSTNSPNVWVFIAQLVKHYSANAEAWLWISLKSQSSKSDAQGRLPLPWIYSHRVNTKTLFADHYQLRESTQNKRATLVCTVRSSGIIFSADEEQHDKLFLPAAIWKKNKAHWHFYFRWRWTRLIPTVGFSQVVEKSWSISGIYTVRYKISTNLLRENAAQLIFL